MHNISVWGIVLLCNVYQNCLMIKLIDSTLFLLGKRYSGVGYRNDKPLTMNLLRNSNPYWERISVILCEQHLSAAALAKVLGLPDPRALYRIKNKNGRITPRLAATIHRVFPEYDAEWLQNGKVTFMVEVPMGTGEHAAVTFSRRISKRLRCNASVWNSAKKAWQTLLPILFPYLRQHCFYELFHSFLHFNRHLFSLPLEMTNSGNIRPYTLPKVRFLTSLMRRSEWQYCRTYICYFSSKNRIKIKNLIFFLLHIFVN